MLPNHGFSVILAPISLLINLIFSTNFKNSPQKCFLVTTDVQTNKIGQKFLSITLLKK